MLKLSHWSGCKMPLRTTERFSEFHELASIDLTKVRLYDGSRWLPRSVTAITLSLPLFSWLFGSTRIYFHVNGRAGSLTRTLDTLPSIELFAEELYHAKQQLETGATKFYVVYLWEYFQHRSRGSSHVVAYNAISFEREAKAFARTAAMFVSSSLVAVEGEAA